MKYILSLDQGTTSSRAILFDQNGQMKSVAQKEFQQYYPHPGWVEHDALEIWETQLSVARDAIAKLGISAREIAAIVGSPQGTISSKLFRAFKKMRIYLEGGKQR